MCKVISDNETYLKGMRNTYHDKSWFMSIIPEEIDMIIDFGCADGSFIEYMKKNWPDYSYYGVEENEEFLKACKDKGIEACKSIQEVVTKLAGHLDKTLLVMNSVLHEVYTYKGAYEAEQLWHVFSNNGIKYIALRDMYAKGCGVFSSKTQDELYDVCRKKDKHVSANNGEFIALGEKLDDFERQWGEVSNGYNMTHFLLKYFYNMNWERELVENYIPFHYRELHEAIREVGYDITYENFYSLPWLKQKWLNDFDCDTHPALHSFIARVLTHMKLFLKFENFEDTSSN